MSRKKPGQSPKSRTGSRVPNKPPTPFSLILAPAELAILRQMATRHETSVGGVVRDAIHTALFRTHPDLARQLAERETRAFLDSLTTLYPGLRLSPVRRARLQRRVVSALLKR
jgi:hypothetical protein